VSEINNPSKASTRDWLGLTVLALPCLLYSMDLTVLNLAVPRLTAELAPSSAQLLWIVDIYGFMLAGSLITMGTLGDRIGRRRMLLIGASVFGTASVLTAFSTSAAMLIFARALLGIAASTLAPSTLSLIRHMFTNPRERTFAIAVWVASFSAGAAIGPLIGGLLLEYFWWGSMFLIAVPVMMALLIFGPMLLPEFRNPDAGRLDLLSAVFSIGAVLAVIFGLKRTAQDGLDRWAVASIVIGLVIGAIFVHRQRSQPRPFIDLRVFGNRAFNAALAANAIDFFVGFGIFLFVAQYLQLVLGLSPLKAGLWTVPWACSLIAGSLVTPACARRIRPAFVMAGGLVLAAVGFGILVDVGAEGGLGFVVTGSVIFSFGLAPMTTLATDMMIGNVPSEEAGAASAISETSSEIGGALGIAVVGCAGAAVYRHGLAAIPVAVSPRVEEAVRNTLGGAIAATAGLPTQLGDTLRHAAREAFARSFQAAAMICAALSVMTAIWVVASLRNISGPTSEANHPN